MFLFAKSVLAVIVHNLIVPISFRWLLVTIDWCNSIHHCLSCVPHLLKKWYWCKQRFLCFINYGLPDTQVANIGNLYINLKLTLGSIQFCSWKVTRVHLQKLSNITIRWMVTLMQDRLIIYCTEIGHWNCWFH